MKEPKSIYIAGPMRGYAAFNYPAFNAKAKELRDNGIIVYNPAEISDHYGTPEEIDANPTLLQWIMNEELKLIRGCADAIYLLEGWENSVGAKEELSVYLSTGKRNVFIEIQ